MSSSSFGSTDCGGSATICATDPHGLVNRFPTFGSLPNFPHIGGAPAVEGWDSAACGTCWQITYNGQSINVLAIDVGRDGFNLSEEAMNDLTNGQAAQLGRVDASATQVAPSVCGL